jgi:hypothetical protein
MLHGQKVKLIYDKEDRSAGEKVVKLDNKGGVKLTLLPEGGALIVAE